VLEWVGEVLNLYEKYEKEKVIFFSVREKDKERRK
jgi:hypothetical protein